MTSGSLDYGRFDELAEEFAERYRRGERPDLQEYVDRLPAMAEEIREMFPAMAEVEQAEVDARGVAAGPPPQSSVTRMAQIGDYRILREVGRGGMGVVYEAEQISLGRRVALKVLPRSVLSDRRAVQRFRREAKAAARLHHTNIVPIFEVGRDGDCAFYAMQLIEGQGLDQVIDELRGLRVSDRKSSGHDPDQSKQTDVSVTLASDPVGSLAGPMKRRLGRMAESLLSGVLMTEALVKTESLTRAPIRRGEAEVFESAPKSSDARDFEGREPPPTPDVTHSAMLPGGTALSIADSSGHRQPYFRSVAQIGRQAAQGLAHAHSRGIIHRDIKPSNLMLDTAGVVWITDFGLAKDEDNGLTVTGDILGTLRYMAPERFRGEGDARADGYALGLTLYELLTLRPAFDSSDRLKLVEQINTVEPTRPRLIDGRIPRDLETIVLKAIAKDPERRYVNADAMAEDLRRFLADEPIHARQVTLSERYWRWARRNPTIAVLGGVLTTVLVVATLSSLLFARKYAGMADRERVSAVAERSARQEADQARTVSEKARGAAQVETYNALLSEVRALRAGRQLGWRDEALETLARLSVMPTRRRDLVELRTEAVASLGEFGVKEAAQFDLSGITVNSLDFSPDSRSLVTASSEGNLDLWDVPGRRRTRQLVGVSKSSTTRAIEWNGGLVRFLPDGELAFLDASQHVGFLGVSGQPSNRLLIKRGTAKAVKLAIDRQGRWLAVGWNDGHLDLYDAGTGGLRRSFDWNPWDFAFSPDGRWLATQSRDGPIQLLPTSGEDPPFTLGHRRGFFPALAFSPDGATLASVADRSVVLWDLASREEKLTLGGHKESVTAVAFSPDGAMLATSCGDRTTRIWDARDGTPLAVLPGSGFMRSLAFSPDGNLLAASAEAGPVHLYELKGRREQRRLVGHKFGALRLAFHPRLPRLASSSNDHSVILWDAEPAHSLVRWKAHDVWVTGLAFSPDGSLIASAGGDAGSDTPILLWDAENGTLRKRLPGNSKGVWILVFDPTSRRLASGDSNGTVLLFDVESGRILRRESLGNSPVRSIVFLNGGRHLLVGLRNGTVALFDLDQSGPPRRIELPEGCGRLLVDSRKNRAIVGDSKGTIITLTLPDLTVDHRLAKGNGGSIESIALSPDGRLLATGGTDRRVVLRDSATFEVLLTFPAWSGTVEDLGFDVSGRWLGFLGANTDVDLWDLTMVHDELAAVGLAWDQKPHLEPTPADLTP